MKSSNEDINSNFYTVQNIFQKIPDDLKNKVFRLVLKNKENQFAIAILKKNDRSVDVFGSFYPKNRNRRMIHSEQQRIKKIETKERQNKIKDYYEMILYSKKAPVWAERERKLFIKSSP